jgi:transcriptional regulator with XRE-family HTH domain
LTDADDLPNVSPMFDHATARATRIQAGLTPTEVASSIGVSERTVTRWEAGQGEPDYSTGLHMEAVLGLSPGALYRLPEEVR